MGRRTVRVSVSIGLAVAGPGTTFADVLAEADLAMYGAKARGRGLLHAGAAAGTCPSRASARYGVPAPPAAGCPGAAALASVGP